MRPCDSSAAAPGPGSAGPGACPAVNGALDQAAVDGLLARVIAQAKAAGIPVAEDIRPTVALNSRATGRFGCCVRKNGGFTIELSSRLLGAEERAVMQTLAHEVLHTCRGCSNHGARWKGYAARMNAAYGYDIARTDSCEKLGVPDTARVRYLLVCTRCGAQIRRSRRSRLVDHPERYRCRCGGTLEVRRVEGESPPGCAGSPF